MEKLQEYSTKIIASLNQGVFNAKSTNAIDLNELKDDWNITMFFLALSQVVPAHVAHHLTGIKRDSLEFSDLMTELMKNLKNEK